jgi:hypothetical protein
LSGLLEGIDLIEKEFEPELLYNKIVHFYIDKKNYSKDQANSIAQNIIKREIQRRKCKNLKCGHSFNDHIRNSETCLVLECNCLKFEK